MKHSPFCPSLETLPVALRLGGGAGKEAGPYACSLADCSRVPFSCQAAYDKVRKAKKQAAERTQKLDERRKKVKLGR